MKIIDYANSKNIIGFITANIEIGCLLVINGWSGYNSVINHGYTHEVNIVSNDKKALPHVYMFIFLLKRWILGTHQGGI
jgi:hypothetical protein